MLRSIERMHKEVLPEITIQPWIESPPPEEMRNPDDRKEKLSKTIFGIKLKWRFLAPVACLAMTGCASSRQAYQDRLDAVMRQQRMMDTFVMLGENMQITGVTEIRSSIPLAQLTTPKTTAETWAPVVGKVAMATAALAAPVVAAGIVDGDDKETYVSDVRSTTSTTRISE